MQEVFKDIPYFENGYQVSNLGRVKSLACMIEKANQHGTFFWPKREKMLTPSPNNKGYLCVGCGVNGRFGVHELVARTFIGPKPYGQQVRHKDGNRKNNIPSNLEYGTQSENNHDIAKHDRLRVKRSVVEAIKKASGSQQDIADRFNVSQTYVGRVKRGVRRPHG